MALDSQPGVLQDGREWVCRLKFQSFADDAWDARRARLDAIRSTNEWNRYVSCNPLPRPDNESHLNDFMAAEAASVPSSVNEALFRMHAALTIIHEIDQFSIMLIQAGSNADGLSMYKAKLYSMISSISDMATAWFLRHCDYFADEEGSVRHEEIVEACKWGLWLNINKNPRMKLLEFPVLGCSLEIVKQLALAPIAIRAQHLPTCDEHNSVCTNELIAVGLVMTFELLTLPPPSKATVNQWVMHMHSPLTNSINKIPYPIPPAGADPNTWTADEDVPPLTITVAGVPAIVQLSDDPLKVPLVPFTLDACSAPASLTTMHTTIRPGSLITST